MRPCADLMPQKRNQNMPDVRVRVNDQTYTLSCDPGEEERVRRLAAYLSAHVERLTASLGFIGEGRLMMLAGLHLCDELFTAREQLMARAAPVEGLVDMLHGAAARIEAMAAQLEPGASDASATPLAHDVPHR